MKLYWPLHEKIIQNSPWSVALIDGVIKVYCTRCRETEELETVYKIPTWTCNCKETIVVAPLDEASLAEPIKRLKIHASTDEFEKYPETLEEAEKAADEMLLKYGEAKALLIQQFRLLHELVRFKELS